MKNLQNLTTLFALVFLYSCSGSTTESADTSKTTLFEVVAPESVGMISDSLALIREHIQWAIDGNYIAGGVALVAKDNKIVYNESIGFGDREKTAVLNTDHIFRIASMTKTITTVALMQLYEQGKLNLSDPVSKYIPEFEEMKVIDEAEGSNYSTKPAENQITIHHLLTHTSGMPYGYGHPVAGPIYAPFGVVDGWTKDSVLLQDNIAKMARLPLVHEPGTGFTYGTSIDVLGRVVEVLSGVPLDEYLEQNIFSLLGMKDTYFYLPEDRKDRLVDVWFTEGFDPNQFPESVQEDFPVNGAQMYFSGGGGLSSTAMDYLKFASIFLNKGSLNDKKILEETTIDLMMKNQLDTLSRPDGSKFGYGGSVRIAESASGIKVDRYGWAGYFQTTYWVDPSRNIVAIMLTNARNTPKWGELLGGFEEIVNKSVVE